MKSYTLRSDTFTLNFHVLFQVGVVEQEPVLFDATIGENIAHGLVNSKATQAEIETAAKVC